MNDQTHASQSRSFGDVLAARVAERESQIVLGIDPDPMALWPGVPEQRTGSIMRDLGAAVLAHCRALIEAAAPACVAVKPQLACFERLRAAGWEALEGVLQCAQEHNLLVIADGKRGDISVSADAYAQALLGQTETPMGALDGLGADMITVNPLMGAETVECFLRAARGSGGGLFVLVRTSNPGAADIEDLQLEGGGTVWERLASMVDELGASGIGQAGLSDVGAVMGATVPEHLQRARELMSSAVFLLPGVGAQGGRVEELAPAFLPGRAGGLISASRGISGAHELTGEKPARAARTEAERLRAAAWSIS